MVKPKRYKLEQCPTSDGFMQCELSLEAERDGDYRCIFISTNHTIELKPKNARAMAKRLLLMAEWVEKDGGK